MQKNEIQVEKENWQKIKGKYSKFERIMLKVYN
jgi:hypothetical protein